jgi:outer membrane protein TolC
LLADGGLTNARLIVANNIIDVAFNQYLLTIDEVLLTATQSYLDYERNRKIHEVILKNKEVAIPLLENLKRLKSVGLIDATKVLTAKQTFSNLELAETEVLSRIAVVSDSLLDIFGTEAENIDVKLADIINSVADNNILKESQSFEVEIAKLNLKLAIGQLNEHEKSKWGSLSGRVVLDVPVSKDSAGADASVGLIFTKTLGDSGRHLQIKKKLEANINRKQNFLRTTEDAAKVQISSLLEQLNTLKKTQDLNETIKSNVQLKIVQLNKQLSIGSTEFGELLQSRIELFNLERDLINLETEISLTQLRFLRATGQLKAILKISPTLERENL